MQQSLRTATGAGQQLTIIILQSGSPAHWKRKCTFALYNPTLLVVLPIDLGAYTSDGKGNKH